MNARPGYGFTVDEVLASLNSDAANCQSSTGPILDAARDGVPMLRNVTSAVSRMEDRLIRDAEMMRCRDNLIKATTIKGVKDLKALQLIREVSGKSIGTCVYAVLNCYQKFVLRFGTDRALDEIYEAMNTMAPKKYKVATEHKTSTKAARAHAAELYGDCLIALSEFLK